MRVYATIIGIAVAISAATWAVSVRVAKAPVEPTPTATTTTTTGVGVVSILPYDSGVRGTVLLGPTCPVMRDPPDPKCADRPYATTIEVSRNNSEIKSPFVTGKSDVNGVFQISLPPGSYTLLAVGGKMLPHCSPIEVTVGATGYTTTTIYCDTGIR